MARLASIKDFESYVGHQASDAVRVSVGMALDLATLYIANQLQSDFSRLIITDQYAIPVSYTRAERHRIVLRLSHGFMASEEPAVVGHRYAKADDYVAVNDNSLYFNFLKGLVMVDEDTMSSDTVVFEGVLSSYKVGNLEIQVVYVKGFEEVEDVAAGNKYIGVPQPLKDACLIQSLEVFDALQEKEEVKYTAINKSGVLTQYRRYDAFAITPFHSVEG